MESDPEAPPGRPSILHLEDDPNDAELIQFHLAKKFPCSVTWVSTREAFVNALAAGGFDLILSDYRMPGFTGDDALKYLREHHDGLPFIMLTGELGEDRAIETIKRGATDYVLKGNLARLVPSIERALREARVAAERRRAEAELRELKDQLSRELRDMQRLHELSTHLLSDKDPDQTLQRVLEACVQLLGADKGTFQLYDDVAECLTLKRHVGFGPELERQYGLVAVGRDCTCGQAIRRRRRTVTENVFTDDSVAGLRDFFRLEGLTACVSTPLVGRDGKILGMLSAHFSRPHRPTDHELGMLDLYVQQAVRVIEYMRAEA
jgi:DNA-binding response OmpR family regulator